MAAQGTHQRGRSAWIWPLVGALAFVTGLQKRYILDPVTEWLRELPDAAALTVAGALVVLVVGTMVRRERRRRAAVSAARATIATHAQPPSPAEAMP